MARSWAAECALQRLNPSRLILVTGFFVLFFSNGSRYALELMLKPMTEDLRWSRSTLSFAVTFFMFTSALVLPVAGRLVDRYSLRWVIAIGVALLAVGIGLMSRVAAPWQVFLVYGLVFAIGHAGTSGCSSTAGSIRGTAASGNRANGRPLSTS